MQEMGRKLQEIEVDVQDIGRKLQILKQVAVDGQPPSPSHAIQQTDTLLQWDQYHHGLWDFYFIWIRVTLFILCIFFKHFQTLKVTDVFRFLWFSLQKRIKVTCYGNNKTSIRDG